MNVYDFDRTIFERDSTFGFSVFCLGRRLRLLRYVPGQLVSTVVHFSGLINRTRFRQSWFHFLRSVPDPQAMVELYWRENRGRIKHWYIGQQKPDDVIISATPEFVLEPICRELGIRNLIASRVDPTTGRYLGPHCSGEEKVRRFRECFGEATVDQFYSDSLSDTPMAMLARESFLVRGDIREPWPFPHLPGKE